MRKYFCVAGAMCLAVFSNLQAADSTDSSGPAETTRLLRFPATNGSEIVFSYTGQLYTVAPSGGIARRLTSSPGYAIFPRFSPDGRELAYTAQYDGNTEVYLMAAGGGPARRLTYTATLGRDDLGDRMGPNNLVLAWAPAGVLGSTEPRVVFRSRMRSFNDFIGQLYAAPRDGDLPSQLPVPAGGFVSFSPDGTQMAYNRVFREFRTWKDYRGGMADDIWIFDLKSGQIENLTQNPAQDIVPMWAPNGRIYFLSDRDGRMNLFSSDPRTRQTEQLTHFRDFDIKFPSIGPGAIVFEEAGQIWRFDLATGRAQVVPISVREDAAVARGGNLAVTKWVTEAHPSPDGQRAVVVARGDIFTVPAKHGFVRNLTATSGVHERSASWSPDGKSIAYVSDETGEFEIYVRPQAGGPAVQVTHGSKTYVFTPTWSPDGRKLLWADRAQRLRYVDVATQQVTEVARSDEQEFQQYGWSPDSKWITYVRPFDREEPRVELYSLDTRGTLHVTDPGYEADSPNFSDDGKFLLFASSRDFHPLYNDLEWNHAYVNMQRVYLLALAADTRSPLEPQNDEVGAKAGDDLAGAKGAAEKKEPDEDRKAGGAKKDAIKPVRIDEAGLSGRVIGLPLEPSNYGSLRLVGDNVYYLRRMAAPQGEGAPEAATLAVFSLKDRKETVLGECDTFEISRDGKRMLVKSGHDLAFLDLPVAKLELKDKLDLAGLAVRLDRAREWRQIYDESWRQMRDYFYDPGMHGSGWEAVRAKYAALLPYVKYRYDLTYLIGEMIAELHVGHSYVGGGDTPAARRVPMGLLGAEFARDPASRAYRVVHLLPGANWNPRLRSPLTELGVGVQEGDYLLAINGTPVRDLPNLFAGLIDTVGKPVSLRVNHAPIEAGARDVLVVPTDDEAPLYYERWINHNQDYVARRTHGRVGYVHIPDMGPDGLNEFARHYYPQISKEGMIIDDRGNGGGNVSPMIIERLRRSFEMWALNRGGRPQPDPGMVRNGPTTVLVNEYSASDGDLFPYRVKYDHLGLVIGRRTWGGAVGIRGPLPLVDGGQLFKPEFSHYATDGKSWVVEGHGVDPDIVVDNDPAAEFRGEDQQLDRAIEETLRQLPATPFQPPGPPPYPDQGHGGVR